LKIGFVEIPKILTKSKRAQAQQKKLQDFYERRKAEIQTLQKNLEDLRDQIQKQGPMLKEDTREQKIKDYQIREVELKLELQKADRTWKVKQQEANEHFRAEVIKIITQVRKEKGIHLVIDAMSLLSADDTMDITDLVIAKFDAGKGAAGPAPAKAPKQKPRPKRNPPRSK
jgi:Skp family chaperone for outer membrane proteins